MEMTVWHSYL